MQSKGTMKNLQILWPLNGLETLTLWNIYFLWGYSLCASVPQMRRLPANVCDPQRLYNTVPLMLSRVLLFISKWANQNGGFGAAHRGRHKHTHCLLSSCSVSDFVCVFTWHHQNTPRFLNIDAEPASFKICDSIRSDLESNLDLVYICREEPFERCLRSH